LTEEEKAVLNMTESELFERGATLTNDIMMNAKRMSYERSVFSNDLVKSDRLTSVSASGTGMQREPGRPRAAKGVPPVVVSGGVQRASGRVPVVAKVDPSHKVDIDSSSGDDLEVPNPSLQAKAKSTSSSSRSERTDSESSFTVVGKGGKPK
jgi:hypothetical protein